MEITAQLIAPAMVQQIALANMSDTSFADELDSAQQAGAPPPSGAPPGADSAQGGEVANAEPNAPSQEPDSRPQAASDQDSANTPGSQKKKRSDSQTALSAVPGSVVLGTGSISGGEQSSQSFGASDGPSAAKSAILESKKGTILGDTNAKLGDITGNPLFPAKDPSSNSAAGPQRAIDTVLSKALGLQSITTTGTTASPVVTAPTAGATSLEQPSEKLAGTAPVRSTTMASQPQAHAKVEATTPQANASDTSTDSGSTDAGSSGANGGTGFGNNQDRSDQGSGFNLSSSQPGHPAIAGNAENGPAGVLNVGLTAYGIGTSDSKNLQAVAVALTALDGLSAAQSTLVMRQTADKIALLAAARNTETVTVHLSPPELGDITLAIKSAGSKVDAQIGASNDNVRHAFQQNTGALAHQLSTRGLELNSVSVGSNATGSSGSQAQMSQGQNGNEQTQARASSVTTGSSAVPVSDSSTPSADGSSGVDIKI